MTTTTQQLPSLSYAYEALEPSISAEIMHLHHEKHHATYVNKLNEALKAQAIAVEKDDLSAMIALQSAIRFHGGGHLNHSLFWENLAPAGEGGNKPPEGELCEAINAQFGSLENLIAKLSELTIAIQGSGWGWLGFNPQTKHLALMTCANQDLLQITTGLIPLLGIDAWEHAYYSQYKNDRATYVKNIWAVINWKAVAERFAKAKKVSG